VRTSRFTAQLSSTSSHDATKPKEQGSGFIE
jgi:hypothetical protein